jgi:hypothetical protein
MTSVIETTEIHTDPHWRHTALGTPIQLWSSAPLSELSKFSLNQCILLFGGVHGDEPEGVKLAQETLQWLISETKSEAQLLPWIVIPCLNVDGFAQQTRVNGRGVDLNRNYPAKNWSPLFEKERYNPGPSPGSEPEVQGIVELLKSVRPKLVIHCHSWQPCIVATGTPGLPIAEMLSQSSGYKVIPEIGYPTPGSLSQYGWHDQQIPIICIEEQELLTDLDLIWPRFLPAMSKIFKKGMIS